jgi:hypothetical protein
MTDIFVLFNPNDQSLVELRLCFHRIRPLRYSKKACRAVVLPADDCISRHAIELDQDR